MLGEVWLTVSHDMPEWLKYKPTFLLGGMGMYVAANLQKVEYLRKLSTDFIK